jgi:quercetin dioxygenase-like cupin family protein
MKEKDKWIITDTLALDWQQTPHGQEIKQIGTMEGTGMILSRVPPGCEGPAHIHPGLEYLYVIEGSVVSNGIELKAGSAYIAGSGTEHQEFYSETGAVFIVVFTLPE